MPLTTYSSFSVLMFLVDAVFFVSLVHGTLDITLLHTNDIHARFEETDDRGGLCTDQFRENDKCYGGIARRKTAIDESIRNDPNVILLDAGDQFQGPTLWFYFYKGLATAHFMNLLDYDVMALGNHEFDNGVTDLVDFLRNVTFPVISCNIDSANEPAMNGLYACSHIREVEGQKIAVVGYTTVTTMDFAKPGNLIFNDEINVLKEEVSRLQDQGINKIIALGHSGIDKDLEIARSVPGIDVVVGGHSNTFLYTGEPPSTQVPSGEYPTVITPDDDENRRVLVVHAYMYGIYLGHLQLTFDDEGEVETYGGYPILLDSSVAKDTNILAEVQTWGTEVETVASTVVGQSVVELVGDISICGVRECNLGNMLTDAMAFTFLDHSNNQQGWSSVPLTIQTAGSIASSLDEGNITIGQLSQIMPYGNTIDVVELKGRDVIETLETAVADIVEGSPIGSFPQVSGMRAEFELLNPPMERVISLYVLCSECLIPEYGPIDGDIVYKVAMNSYMAGGGGFGLIKERRLSKISGDLDLDVTIAYISANTPIRSAIEGRITVYDSTNRPPSGAAVTKLASSWILFAAITMNLIFIM